MGKESTWNGTLSPNEFQVAAKAFVEKWKGCISVPGWTWKTCSRLPYALAHTEGSYLSLESVYQHVSEEEGYSLENSTLAEEVADVATLVQDCDTETHVYNFHIIYSDSYRVPVLYFRGHTIEGQALDWNTIMADLPPSSTKMLDESRWTFITQEEHPYMNQPWFSLHPCGTSDWMKLMFVDRFSFVGVDGRAACISNYLLSWLSVAGQAVGLKVPLNLLIEHENLPADS